jgi:hypothetical protein
MMNKPRFTGTWDMHNMRMIGMVVQKQELGMQRHAHSLAKPVLRCSYIF